MQRCALVVGGVLAAVAITGCAGGGIAAPVDSPVAIEISPFFLTVRNVGSQPLTDLTIGIKPGGVRPEYQMSLRRLGLRQDVDIPYADFRGVDRDSLNLQVVRPRSVHITGTDRDGTVYDIELPWQ